MGSVDEDGRATRQSIINLTHALELPSTHLFELPSTHLFEVWLLIKKLIFNIETERQLAGITTSWWILPSGFTYNYSSLKSDSSLPNQGSFSSACSTVFRNHHHVIIKCLICGITASSFTEPWLLFFFLWSDLVYISIYDRSSLHPRAGCACVLDLGSRATAKTGSSGA